VIKSYVRRIQEIYYLTQHFQNWNEIALSVLKNKKPREIILKNGLIIKAPENNTLIGMAREIFFEQVYFPQGWSIETNDVVVDIGANIGFLHYMQL